MSTVMKPCLCYRLVLECIFSLVNGVSIIKLVDNHFIINFITINVIVSALVRQNHNCNSATVTLHCHCKLYIMEIANKTSSRNESKERKKKRVKISSQLQPGLVVPCSTAPRRDLSGRVWLAGNAPERQDVSFRSSLPLPMF